MDRAGEREGNKVDAFEGRTAVVTGAASGIGRAVCEGLAAMGASLVLADIDDGLLEETVRSIRRAGGEARGEVVDVTDHEAVCRLVDGAVQERGRLDYMFNNAGVAVFGDAADLSYRDWRWVIDVDLMGVVNGVYAAYPVMVRQGCGHIVNTASLAGLVPATGEISYTTAKYGVVGLSNALRVEGKAYGVKVSVVCPGFIRTPLYETISLVRLDRDRLMKIAPKGMPVDRCARTIIRGVERNRAVIPITGGAWVLWGLQRLSPGLVRFMLEKTLIGPIRKCRT